MRVNEFEDAISSASGVHLKVLPQSSRDFRALMHSDVMGRLSLSEIECDSAVIERPGRHDEGNRYFVMVQLAGTGVIKYGAQQFDMAPGDFFVADPADSYQNIFKTRVRRLVIRVERQDLLARLPRPLNICGRLVSGEAGPAKMFGRLVKELVADASACDPHARTVVSSSVLNLLAVAIQSSDICVEAAQDVRQRSNYARMLAFIEANLCDPQLDTELMARALKVSPRHVQSVFELSGTTVREVIRERRLEYCYERLLDQGARHRTVSEIAFEAGFNSIEHFCRLFKARYQATPKSVRAKQLS